MIGLLWALIAASVVSLLSKADRWGERVIANASRSASAMVPTVNGPHPAPRLVYGRRIRRVWWRGVGWTMKLVTTPR